MESTDGTANIDTANCQTHITTLGSGNICIANPFHADCTDALLGGADDETTQLEAAALRTTYCSTGTATFTDTTSLGIRGGATNAYCRGAVDNFCKGDNLFASASGAGVFNCLSDTNAGYNTARATHAGLCANVASGDRVTAGTACDLAEVQICTATTIGLQTNPWSSICSEDSADPTAARQAVINACLAKDEGTAAGQRGEDVATNVCIRTITDASPIENNDVVEILATCDDDPRDAVCDDFAGTANEGYANARSARYVSGCADSAAIAGNAALCPPVNVQPVICVTNAANSRPFAPICAGVTGIDGFKTEVLLHCLTTDTQGEPRCDDMIAPSTKTVVDLVRNECGGFAPTDNPFDTAASVTGVTATLDCNTYSVFNDDRTNFRTACRTAAVNAVDYNTANCSNKGTVLADICSATLTANSNPFSGICDKVTHLNARTLFANACANPTANSGTLNLATCPTDVMNCATNPFNAGCTDDDAYNGQKRLVLALCQGAAATSTGSGTDARCTTALAQTSLTCLKDPIACTDTQADTQFALADGAGTASVNARTYRDTVRTNRLQYCRGGDLVNSQKSICRTAHTATAACLRNPFGNCTTELGAGNLSDYRTNRLAYCRNSANADQTSISNTNTATISDTDVNLCNAPSTEIDAAGVICGSISDSTFAFEAGLDNMRDPFIAACIQITDYNDERSTRISDCSTAAFDQTTWACNYAAQATYCDESTAPMGCLPIQTVTRWRENFGAAVAFSHADAVAGLENKFINNFNAAGPDAGLEVVEYNSARATRITDSTLTNAISLAFLSARIPAVAAGRFVTQTDVDNDTNNATMSVIVGGVPRAAVAGDIGTTPITEAVDPGHQRFYVGFDDWSMLRGAGSVGAPVFDRAQSSAIWTGQIHWIGAGLDANSNVTAARTGFKMEVDYIAATIEGAVSVDHTATNGLGRLILLFFIYMGGVFFFGVFFFFVVGGCALSFSPPPFFLVFGGAGPEGLLSGIIGNKAAIGVFIGPDITDSNPNSFGGGFIVKPQ